MKTTRYLGVFISNTGNRHEIVVYGHSALQAFFLLTADAIRDGLHYQLDTITNTENGKTWKVDDICACSNLLEEQQ
jgi:hypothetical protein